MGGQGEPDVVATAPLGDRAYTVVVECKTVASAENQVRNPAAQEAGRLRDAVGGDYAILLGADFPRDAEIDGELRTHRVALWTCEDLVTLLRAHAVHAIRWSRLPPLLAPGRASDAIAEFGVLHVHGARKRAHIAYRLGARPPAWLRYYNEERRHTAINYETPASRWAARQRGA